MFSNLFIIEVLLMNCKLTYAGDTARFSNPWEELTDFFVKYISDNCSAAARRRVHLNRRGGCKKGGTD